MKISVCVFIKDNNRCGFGLWESMSQLMPLADEFFVFDVGSTDGTWEDLQSIKNPKLRLEQGEWPINPVTGRRDAGSFAEIPNQIIPRCKHETVLYYQADEIWHDDLIELTKEKLKGGVKSMSFWRYQLSHNFQKMKWPPHLVHRLGQKNNFVFVDDGMNTKNMPEVCSHYNGGWFTRWGAEYSKGRLLTVDKDGNEYVYGNYTREITEGMYPWEMPTNEMILDISSIGGFLNNVRAKTKNHSPFWGTDEWTISIKGKLLNFNGWYDYEKENPEWTRAETKFNIPEIIKPLLGTMTYPGLRPEIKHKIENS